MVKLALLVLSYFNGNPDRVSSRENLNFTTALGTKLTETYRGWFRQQQLRIDRAELYAADPNGPDEYYAQAGNLKRLDLNSTGAQIIQKSGIAAPLVVLKLFIADA